MFDWCASQSEIEQVFFGYFKLGLTIQLSTIRGRWHLARKDRVRSEVGLPAKFLQ